MIDRKALVVGLGVLCLCCGFWSCSDSSTNSGPRPLSAPIGWISVWAEDDNLNALPTPVDPNPGVFPDPIALRDVSFIFQDIAFYNTNGDRFPVKVDDGIPAIGLLGPITTSNVPDPGTPGVQRFFQSVPLPAGEYNAFEARLVISNIKIVVQTTASALPVWTCSLPANQQEVVIPRMSVTGSAITVGANGADVLISVPVTGWDWCQTNGGVGALTLGAITVGPRT